jgi:hypothetical protein
MFRAMAMKELREIRGIVLVALILYGMITIAAIDPKSPINLFWLLSSDWQIYGSAPFIQDQFVGRYYFFAGVMAIALGLWQTFGESARGTYPFLLHRPASGRRLIGMKLIVGSAVYLICTVVPLGVYSLWAATPGVHASPFEWSMTVPSWVAWLAMTVLYYGAFLSGIRPGRWYRSRFLPLAAALSVVILVVTLASNLFEGMLWPCMMVLVVDIWMIATIFFAAQSRDYA